jgi:hypothetical protein
MQNDTNAATLLLPCVPVHASDTRYRRAHAIYTFSIGPPWYMFLIAVG